MWTTLETHTVSVWGLRHTANPKLSTSLLSWLYLDSKRPQTNSKPSRKKPTCNCFTCFWCSGIPHIPTTQSEGKEHFPSTKAPATKKTYLPSRLLRPLAKALIPRLAQVSRPAQVIGSQIPPRRIQILWPQRACAHPGPARGWLGAGSHTHQPGWQGSFSFTIAVVAAVPAAKC